MKRRIAGVVLLCSMILLSISGYFLADMLLQERKDDVLQDQLKEIYEDSKNRVSDGKLMETQTANYFSDIYPIDCAVLSANAQSCQKCCTLLSVLFCA